MSLNVGRPPKLYDLDIDTGSDLTWLQCDAPCTGCTKVTSLLFPVLQKFLGTVSEVISLEWYATHWFYCGQPRNLQYKPNNNLVHCEDPLCSAIRTSVNKPCKTPDDQCDYEVEYADQGSSLGVLVNDYFTFQLTNSSRLSPRLAFG